MERLPGNPDGPLRRGVRRVVAVQAFLTILLAAGFGLWRGWGEALAALYGGAVTLLSTGWLGWRMQRAGDQRYAGAGMGLLYSGVVIRYASAVILLALGLGVLRLAPLPLVAAFGLAQFGFFAHAPRR